jgi:hypothetical protein
MKTKKLLVVIFILPLLFLGCMEINEEFKEIRNEVITQFGDDYKSEVQFSIGSVGITISSWFVDFAADEEFISEMMNEVSGVQVGVYKKIKAADEPTFSILNDIEDEMLSNGWKSIVRSAENGDISAVYLRANNDELLERIFIISYSDDELVLVEVEGDLKEVISTVIREKGLEFERI